MTVAKGQYAGIERAALGLALGAGAINREIGSDVWPRIRALLARHTRERLFVFDVFLESLSAGEMDDLCDGEEQDILAVEARGPNGLRAFIAELFDASAHPGGDT